MYFQRIRHIRYFKISPKRIATPEEISLLLPERVNRPSNNLKNLFELPVIFYALCSMSLGLQMEDRILLALAWAFCALRTLHSIIHCTTNHVAARFAAYLASSITLFAMVARFALMSL